MSARRRFLACIGTLGAALGAGCRLEPARAQPAHAPNRVDWQWVREQFGLAPDRIHMSALYIASHPRPVRDAIETYRRMLDADPVLYLTDENDERQRDVREAAAGYLGVDADDIALTDSTTMGVGLVYSGLALARGQEILTTEHDYYVTHEAVRRAAERSGAALREIALYDGDASAAVSAEQIVERIAHAITPATRVVALTWVSSNTGLKLPLARIASVLRDANRDRDEDARILLAVDGVHGFGVEDVTLPELGCDYFMAGCHKWLFGPRGTGIVWARRAAWAHVAPGIPSFSDAASWHAWLRDRPLQGPTTASRFTPGGFQAFEHQWALAEAFEFQRRLGKARVAERTHALARRAKEGLAAMRHVRLHTPLSDALSSGIVTFDVRGMAPHAVVERLREKRIVATTTPYADAHARIAPCIHNTEPEIDRLLAAVHAMG